ncbi:hypothetical protein [Glycomyces paridis]|uniref:hypothetical protein n=1 Tax=Glycomyces paridis TaxID=2126555 RepID=UPI0013054627|nr:hypothetical protein [Glycomyces paridis]
MNFAPPAAPAPPKRRKPLLIGTIAVSWAVIAASAAVIVLNLPGSPADADPPGAADATSGSEEAADAGPLAEPLAELAQAFADGDRDAWTAGFGADEAERAGRYFDNLTALDADPLELRVEGEVTESGTGTRKSYGATIVMSFCLHAADPASCTPTEVDYSVTWEREGESLVLSHFMDLEEIYRPHAWEVADLSVALGDRAVVAVDADAGVDPADYLDAAEEAAANADAYALIEPIDSYLIVLADDDQFDTWYGGYVNDVSLGSAVSTAADADTAGPIHVMMPFERLDDESFAHTARHELGHAATLQGAPLRNELDESTWWMVEGVAEYIANGDTMPADRVADTAALVDSGGCADGIEPMGEGDSASTSSGKYGCSYLAVRYAVDEYGLEAFMDWFAAAVHEGAGTTAASEALGEDHEAVMEAIGAYVQESV